ncbi:metallophosphoesterase [Flavivirga spongiicola]|uniref:Metallophosphoesterase n=1 Tax=Flavivirga spongiicola TaxID=421621 RepID=A0ABU7XYI3_9FLAO|nr:metallophosphoesterase [Flavivirga sp. MEBiC05379]MDO5980861.1 metallophosphoesterase [Flavivirga sp. MEBiC05379]
MNYRNKTFSKYIIMLLCVFCIKNSINAQEAYVPPKLSDSNSWSLILLPDPQSYMKFGRNQGIFELMTGWIEENISTLNIKMVLCTGDLVEQNELLVTDNINGNKPSRDQWIAISKAFDRLDGKVPYILAAGNHDFGYKNIENRKSNYNDYFPAHRNILNSELLREVTYNIDGIPTLENSAFEFVSPHNRKFLFLNLEFAPRDAVIEWAQSLASKKEYKNHTITVLTHSYLNAKNEHIEKENYPIKDGNYGKAIWEKLVKPSTNIQMVFSGHIGAPNNFKAHVGYRIDTNYAGKKVNQITFNAQALGGGWHGNGGNGWLRILEFLPDKKTVKMHTFSPFFAISPQTQEKSWSKEVFNDFSFYLD